MSKFGNTVGGVGFVLIGALLATQAQAQEWSGAPREAPRQGHDRVIIGIGAAAVPTYQGSDDYRTLPIPMIDIVSGPIYANLRNGVGVNVVDTPGFTFGGGVTFMPGYRRQDVPVGVDRLSVGAGARLYASFKAGGVVATLGGTQGFVGSTKGFIADASLSYPIMASPRLLVIPSVATTWADAKHNGRYFGIDTGEAFRSGLPQFRVGGGFKDVSALLTVNYRLTGRMNLSASGGVTSLLGDVKDSPLVAHATRPMGFLSLSYRFGD